MNKFLMIVSLVLTTLFHGCDPAFSYYVYAKNGDAIIETTPTLESVYCSSALEKMCDFAKSHRISEKSDSAIYKISQGEVLNIYGGVGTKASASYFPFKYISIITKADTLVFTDKFIFLNKFIRKGKTNHFFLEL
jgi:hypothetical protein